MKTLLLTCLQFCITTSVFCQSNLISVITTGDGPTETLATNRALRNAIEKTFGVFISSSTEVRNEDLIKDEIATVASGNIASYEIINSLKDGNKITVTVLAKVSPERVVLNLKSMGNKVEIKGNVFAQNVIKEQFYKQQELEVIKDFIKSYQNFKIIDSFSTHLCEPFFANLRYPFSGLTINSLDPYAGKICFERYITKFNLLTGARNDIKEYRKNSINNDILKYSNVSIPAYKVSLIRINSDNNKFNVRANYDKLEKDFRDDFYFLPVIFKPIYNAKKALQLSDAIINLLKSIAIIDKENYIKNLGQTYKINFLVPKNDALKIGTYTSIINGRNETKIPYYEIVVDTKTFSFELRNSVSIQLLESFFNTQFRRSNISAIYITNTTLSSKHFHIQLIHRFMKYAAYDENKYEENSETIRIEPSNKEGFSALYPSVLLLRLSLNDLQNLNGLEFNWLPDEKIPELEDLNY